MDEKGFFVGITTRTKRVFSKAVWASKERTEAIRDGNREWVTVLACVFLANSPSGWTNNELGLAWLEQVFDRHTKAKARRGWRLLILDGHGSHLTPDFLSFCDANRILLAVFPPHSTHTLQPLDVVLFSPLSRNYTHELNSFLQQSQGITRITKREFFTNFWAAWSSTMKPEVIMKSFQATGVWPMDAEVVLQRFNNRTSEQDEDAEIGEHGDGDTYNQLRKIFDAAVADKAKVEARRLSQSLHSLQVNNELLRNENLGLRRALYTKNKHDTKRTTLYLQQGEDSHGGAVF
ncbi:hypothetical protein AA0120_g12237 [Alternaria tenuissima]|nr:hypothetical protein AA0120_g12237 [Alternaria tenuissima]